MGKYIEAEKLKLKVNHEMDMQDTYLPAHFFDIVDDTPAADVVEVVRCRECVMWDGSFTLNGQKKCLNMTFCTDGEFYCGWGSKE